MFISLDWLTLLSWLTIPDYLFYTFSIALPLLGFDFLSGPGDAKVASEQMKEAGRAREDILGFLRESLGYQKDIMKWQQDIYERERTDTEPYREASLGAVADLKKMFGEGYDVTKEKQYQILSEASDRELQKSLAKKGLSLSGYGLEEEARLKTGLKTSVMGQRLAGLGSMAGYGTMGAVGQPMLANMGAISQTYGNMAQVPGWYASQMGNIYQNFNDSSKQGLRSADTIFGSLLGGYLGYGGGAGCWVAEELYGKVNYKTFIIRYYVNKHKSDNSMLGRFCRLYIKYGRSWAFLIKNNSVIRVIARMIWNHLYNKAIKEGNYYVFSCRI